MNYNAAMFRLPRFLIGLVAVWNLQAAIVFILFPQSFVSGYELSGVAGEAAVRGVGVLFLMWNVPYVFAVIDLERYSLGLVFALWMQSVGLVGESLIYFSLPAGHVVLQSSILRFIAFDFTGLVLLFIAYLIFRERVFPKS
ncbi:MAG: hypothetical protein KDD72_09720 [Anaerolineales bacterium]|nr:hypothetical protein [Anaerolineales bacterium]